MVMAAGALVVVVVILVVVVVVVMMGVLLLQLVEVVGQVVLFIDGFAQLGAGELVPRGRDDDGLGIAGAQDGDGGLDLLRGELVGAAEDDHVGGGDLVVVKLAEVLAVQLALGGVGDGDARPDAGVALGALDGLGDVAQLADAGGLDQDAVGMIFGQHLGERRFEVADQTAADAAGIHFGDLDAGILEKAAVNGDLAELVLDEDELFALIGLGDQLADQRRLARAQKARKNVDFCHEEIISF